MRSNVCIPKLKATKLFQAMDIDSTGYLTAAKIRHFMSHFDIHLNDQEMSQMIKMYDYSGTGRIDLVRFYSVLEDLCFQLEDNAEEQTIIFEPLSEEEEDSPSTEQLVEEAENLISLSTLPAALRRVLEIFDPLNTGCISVEHVKKSIRPPEKAHTPVCDARTPDVRFHTERGLGPLVGKVNHIALIVSDVGESSKFYSQVLGFQQIPRPNFDEHGAWFSMGNIELHLIKGRPAVHSGDDLIVCHISIETDNIDEMPAMLTKLGVPFRQNVSVPSEADAGQLGTNTANSNDKIVSQYFIQDPDGYYIEICNCGALEDYTLADTSNISAVSSDVEEFAYQVIKKWSSEAQWSMKRGKEVLKRAHNADIVSIAKELECVKAPNVDQSLLETFMARATVYGDICQGEKEETMAAVLREAGNNAPKANQILSLKARASGKQMLQPPAFYEQGTNFVLPPSFAMPFGH